MHLDEELYYLALAKEKEYLDLINLRDSKHKFDSLEEALSYYFDKEKAGKPTTLEHKDGISKQAAIEILRKIENTPNLDGFMGKQLSDFIKTEIGQVESKDNSDYKKIAGFVDEAVAIPLLRNVFYTDIVTIDKVDEDNKFAGESYKFNSTLKYEGRSSGDFKINIEVYGEESGIFKPANIDKYGAINLENKLNLDSFHIANGNVKLDDKGVSDLEKEYLDLMWESDKNHITGDLDYDILDDPSGLRNYNTYMSYIRLDMFNQVLANYIMYKKLSSTIPIFISPSANGLDFKLCSDVIAEVGHGNFDLKSGINKGDVFTTLNDNNLKSSLINQALQKVGNYQLWYGKR